MTRILIGLSVALAVALGVAGWQLKRSWQAEAATKAALSDALSANATLVKEAARYKADAKAEAERAMARQRERDGLAASVAALKQRLGDGIGECKIGDEQLKAIDEFLNGGKP